MINRKNIPAGDNFDIKLTETILDRINNENNKVKDIKVREIPSFENKSIIDLSGSTFHREFNYKKASVNLKNFTDRIDLKNYGIRKGENIVLTGDELDKIGLVLLPLVSLGVLNGGSATSYTDCLKNSSFNSELYSCGCREFDNYRNKYKNSPKGITPAYINHDSSHGASFMELKMRSLLLKTARYRKEVADESIKYPIFQMTSGKTDKPLSDEYRKYQDSIYLKNLIDKTGTDITSVLTAVQPLIAAYTHSSEGFPKHIFKNAYGRDGEMVFLPGGHGQNFTVLKEIYKKLLGTGKKFVYLGNVDNMGFNIDLSEVALLALTGSDAGFDFSLKTPVDVKGGILVCDEKGKLNCADIGAAVTKNEVEAAEREGKKILFNCATGLFSLEYLVKNIDFIIDSLPLRVSDQEKDAGKYSQAEQITWEVISLLDNFRIFGVNKYKRFLSSKLLIENMLISRPDYFSEYFKKHPGTDLDIVSKNLNKGLNNLLSSEMEMKYQEKRWLPL